MFKLVPNPEFTRTVTAEVPIDSGHSAQHFSARFRALTQPELETYDFDAGPEETTRFLRDVVVSCEQLADTEGNTLTWSPAVADMLFAITYARNALVKTYFAGIAKAKKGN